MKHNVDKLMEGLANLALGHADLKAKVDAAIAGAQSQRDHMNEDINGITDSLRDCTARLDGYGRSLDNISARLNDHKAP